MLQVSTATGAAGLPDCNRRNICPKAAKRKRQRRDERLAQAEWRVKFELTMPPELRMVTPQTIKMQSAMLAKLQRALKRRHGLFHFAWSREQRAGDNLHFHMLADGNLRETELAELAELAAKAGFGMVHLKRISQNRGGSKGAIRYLTKSFEYLAGHADANWPIKKPRLFGTSLPTLPAKRKGSSKENYTWIRNLDENGDPLLPWNA
jgi:hypothetical protein